MPENGRAAMIHRISKKICAAVLAVAAGCLAASCGDDGERACAAAPIALISAFPAEMQAVLTYAKETVQVRRDGHTFRLARIGELPVVITMTGIGLANARRVTSLTAAHFLPRGIVVVGVAGSTRLPIGSVVVPQRWRLRDGREFPVHLPWWELVDRLAPSLHGRFESCAIARLPSGPLSVCMPERPSLRTVDLAISDDPFAGQPFPCQEGGGDLYGCDVPASAAGLANATTTAGASRRATTARVAEDAQPWINDMESAAIAEVAFARRIPFLAFRAVSDGPGDPLQLGSFLDQFTAYYPYAAANAALAASAFLEALPCSALLGGAQ